jgi:hypothetical protein
MAAAMNIAVIWKDEHLIELRISGSNERFAAQVQVYADHDAVIRFAHVLRGFPSSATDSRHFEFGAVGTLHSGGGVQVRFLCVDRSGHAAVQFRFRSEPNDNRSSESASFTTCVEAGDIDAFVAALDQLGSHVGKSAQLGAP